MKTREPIEEMIKQEAEFDRLYKSIVWLGNEPKTDEELLDEVDAEWRRFTERNDLKLSMLVQELVARSVYPPLTVAGTPALQMVIGHGARWHIWSGPLECRHCRADLRHAELGPPYKREIGITENDRCTKFKCPDCGKIL